MGKLQDELRKMKRSQREQLPKELTESLDKLLSTGTEKGVRDYAIDELYNLPEYKIEKMENDENMLIRFVIKTDGMYCRSLGDNTPRKAAKHPELANKVYGQTAEIGYEIMGRIFDNIAHKRRQNKSTLPVTREDISDYIDHGAILLFRGRGLSESKSPYAREVQGGTPGLGKRA